jgi:hypothetical protein
MLKSYKKLNFSIFLASLLITFVPQYSSAQTNPNALVEDIIRFYFADVPIMIDIAKCETGYRQYNADGTALHDASGTYVGVYQISENIHTPKALSMGFDIRTIDGNLGYARYLYTTSSTGPWKGCLPKTSNPAPSPVPATPNPIPMSPGSITATLRIGMTNPQVLLVQQILNRSGFIITQSGGGSPGNETNYFGSLTREALKRFQCAKQIVCTGNESTTGYGRVGPSTRAMLNSI